MIQVSGMANQADLYTNNLKNREFDKEAPQNLCLERVIIADKQGTSEDKNSEAKPTQSKTDSSGCLCIYPADIWIPIIEHLNPLAIRATSITCRKLNELTNQYKVSLFLQEKYISVLLHEPPVPCGTSEKVVIFDVEIITTIEDKTISLTEKAAKIKAYIDSKKICGQPLLNFCAAKNYRTPLLKIILKLGPNLNVTNDSHLSTALFQTNTLFEDCKINIMKELIDAGADFRIKNPVGLTCFEKFKTWPGNANNKEIILLENYANKLWKSLNREKIPIPTKEFTITTHSWVMPKT